MEKSQRNLLLTFLSLFCLYLACQLIPYQKMIDFPYAYEVIEIFFYLALLIWVFVEIYRSSLKRKKIEKINDVFLSLPLLISCFGNLFYGFISHSSRLSFDVSHFIVSCITTILACTIEELLFRKNLLSFFLELWKEKRHGKIYSILLSALCFSLMHVINFTSGAYLNVLIQLGYTFILGIILGVLAVEVNNDILVIIGHSAFNIFDMLLFEYMFSSSSYDSYYFLINGSLLIFALLYSCFLYIHFERRRQHAS